MYKDFIKDNSDILTKLNNIYNGLQALDIKSNAQDIEDTIKILEQDPRIKRISATEDVLEIYTIPIIFDIDYCEVSSVVRNAVDDRHKKLNLGEFVILIKPGFVPLAFPYDCSQYNVPFMYRIYNSFSFYNINDMKRTKPRHEHADIYGMDYYAWALSEVGTQLGCYKIPDNSVVDDEDEDEDGTVKYNIITPHPHVHASGSICYGNVKDMLLNAVETYSINFIVNLTLDVLFTYNDYNPYFHLWRQSPCSNCPDRYTYICSGCGCTSCDDVGIKCKGCSTFRQPSLYNLFKVRRGLLKLSVFDTKIPLCERIQTMKDETQELIDAYLENNPDVSKSEFISCLKGDYIEDILNGDYDTHMR